MSVSDADAAHAVELFSGLGGLTTRKMMGGLCLYRDGTIFAIIHADGGVYLKARSEVITALEAENCPQKLPAMDLYTRRKETNRDALLALARCRTGRPRSGLRLGPPRIGGSLKAGPRP